METYWLLPCSWEDRKNMGRFRPTSTINAPRNIHELLWSYPLSKPQQFQPIREEWGSAPVKFQAEEGEMAEGCFWLRTLYFCSESLIHPLRCGHLGTVVLFYFRLFWSKLVCMEIKIDKFQTYNSKKERFFIELTPYFVWKSNKEQTLTFWLACLEPHM